MTRVPITWEASIDLLCISVDWFLYDKDLHHEGVKKRNLETILNPIQDGGRAKSPPTSFSPVTSRNIRNNPQNFLNFNFNPFAKLM